MTITANTSPATATTATTATTTTTASMPVLTSPATFAHYTAPAAQRVTFKVAGSKGIVCAHRAMFADGTAPASLRLTLDAPATAHTVLTLRSCVTVAGVPNARAMYAAQGVSGVVAVCMSLLGGIGSVAPATIYADVVMVAATVKASTTTAATVAATVAATNDAQTPQVSTPAQVAQVAQVAANKIKRAAARK